MEMISTSDDYELGDVKEEDAISLYNAAQESKTQFLSQHLERVQMLYKSEHQVSCRLREYIVELNQENRLSSVKYDSIIACAISLFENHEFLQLFSSTARLLEQCYGHMVLVSSLYILDATDKDIIWSFNQNSQAVQQYSSTEGYIGQVLAQKDNLHLSYQQYSSSFASPVDLLLHEPNHVFQCILLQSQGISTGVLQIISAQDPDIPEGGCHRVPQELEIISIMLGHVIRCAWSRAHFEKERQDFIEQLNDSNHEMTICQHIMACSDVAQVFHVVETMTAEIVLGVIHRQSPLPENQNSLVGGRMYLLNDQKHQLWSMETNVTKIKELYLSPNEGLVGTVVMNKKEASAPSIRFPTAFEAVIPIFSCSNNRSKSRQRIVLGVLVVILKQQQFWTTEMAHQLRKLTSQVGMSIGPFISSYHVSKQLDLYRETLEKLRHWFDSNPYETTTVAHLCAEIRHHVHLLINSTYSFLVLVTRPKNTLVSCRGEEPELKEIDVSEWTQSFGLICSALVHGKSLSIEGLAKANKEHPQRTAIDPVVDCLGMDLQEDRDNLSLDAYYVFPLPEVSGTSKLKQNHQSASSVSLQLEGENRSVSSPCLSSFGAVVIANTSGCGTFQNIQIQMVEDFVGHLSLMLVGWTKEVHIACTITETAMQLKRSFAEEQRKKGYEQERQFVEKLNSYQQLNEALVFMPMYLADEYNFERVSIFLFCHTNDHHPPELWTILNSSTFQKITLDQEYRGLAGHCLDCDEKILCEDASNHSSYHPYFDRIIDSQTRNVYCIPLYAHNEEKIGVIEFANWKSTLPLTQFQPPQSFSIQLKQLGIFLYRQYLFEESIHLIDELVDENQAFQSNKRETRIYQDLSLTALHQCFHQLSQCTNALELMQVCLDDLQNFFPSQSNHRIFGHVLLLSHPQVVGHSKCWSLHATNREERVTIDLEQEKLILSAMKERQILYHENMEKDEFATCPHILSIHNNQHPSCVLVAPLIVPSFAGAELGLEKNSRIFGVMVIARTASNDPLVSTVAQFSSIDQAHMKCIALNISNQLNYFEVKSTFNQQLEQAQNEIEQNRIEIMSMMETEKEHREMRMNQQDLKNELNVELEKCQNEDQAVLAINQVFGRTFVIQSSPHKITHIGLFLLEQDLFRMKCYRGDDMLVHTITKNNHEGILAQTYSSGSIVHATHSTDLVNRKTTFEVNDISWPTVHDLLPHESLLALPLMDPNMQVFGALVVQYLNVSSMNTISTFFEDLLKWLSHRLLTLFRLYDVQSQSALARQAQIQTEQQLAEMEQRMMMQSRISDFAESLCLASTLEEWECLVKTSLSRVFGTGIECIFHPIEASLFPPEFASCDSYPLTMLEQCNMTKDIRQYIETENLITCPVFDSTSDVTTAILIGILSCAFQNTLNVRVFKDSITSLSQKLGKSLDACQDRQRTINALQQQQEQLSSLQSDFHASQLSFSHVHAMKRLDEFLVKLALENVRSTGMDQVMKNVQTLVPQYLPVEKAQLWWFESGTSAHEEDKYTSMWTSSCQKRIVIKQNSKGILGHAFHEFIETSITCPSIIRYDDIPSHALYCPDIDGTMASDMIFLPIVTMKNDIEMASENRPGKKEIHTVGLVCFINWDSRSSSTLNIEAVQHSQLCSILNGSRLQLNTRYNLQTQLQDLSNQYHLISKFSSEQHQKLMQQPQEHELIVETMNYCLSQSASIDECFQILLKQFPNSSFYIAPSSFNMHKQSSAYLAMKFTNQELCQCTAKEQDFILYLESLSIEKSQIIKYHDCMEDILPLDEEISGSDREIVCIPLCNSIGYWIIWCSTGLDLVSLDIRAAMLSMLVQSQQQATHLNIQVSDLKTSYKDQTQDLEMLKRQNQKKSQLIECVGRRFFQAKSQMHDFLDCCTRQIQSLCSCPIAYVFLFDSSLSQFKTFIQESGHDGNAVWKELRFSIDHGTFKKIWESQASLNLKKTMLLDPVTGEIEENALYCLLYDEMEKKQGILLAMGPRVFTDQDQQDLEQISHVLTWALSHQEKHNQYQKLCQKHQHIQDAFKKIEFQVDQMKEQMKISESSKKQARFALESIHQLMKCSERLGLIHVFYKCLVEDSTSPIENGDMKIDHLRIYHVDHHQNQLILFQPLSYQGLDVPHEELRTSNACFSLKDGLVGHVASTGISRTSSVKELVESSSRGLSPTYNAKVDGICVSYRPAWMFVHPAGITSDIEADDSTSAVEAVIVFQSNQSKIPSYLQAIIDVFSQQLAGLSQQQEKDQQNDQNQQLTQAVKTYENQMELWDELIINIEKWMSIPNRSTLTQAISQWCLYQFPFLFSHVDVSLFLQNETSPAVNQDMNEIMSSKLVQFPILVHHRKKIVGTLNCIPKEGMDLPLNTFEVRVLRAVVNILATKLNSWDVDSAVCCSTSSSDTQNHFLKDDDMHSFSSVTKWIHDTYDQEFLNWSELFQYLTSSLSALFQCQKVDLFLRSRGEEDCKVQKSGDNQMFYSMDENGIRQAQYDPILSDNLQGHQSIMIADAQQDLRCSSSFDFHTTARSQMHPQLISLFYFPLIVYDLTDSTSPPKAAPELVGVLRFASIHPNFFQSSPHEYLAQLIQPAIIAVIEKFRCLWNVEAQRFETHFALTQCQTQLERVIEEKCQMDKHLHDVTQIREFEQQLLTIPSMLDLGAFLSTYLASRFQADEVVWKSASDLEPPLSSIEDEMYSSIGIHQLLFISIHQRRQSPTISPQSLPKCLGRLEIRRKGKQGREFSPQDQSLLSQYGQVLSPTIEILEIQQQLQQTQQQQQRDLVHFEHTLAQTQRLSNSSATVSTQGEMDNQVDDAQQQKYLTLKKAIRFQQHQLEQTQQLLATSQREKEQLALEYKNNQIEFEHLKTTAFQWKEQKLEYAHRLEQEELQRTTLQRKKKKIKDALSKTQMRLCCVEEELAKCKRRSRDDPDGNNNDREHNRQAQVHALYDQQQQRQWKNIYQENIKLQTQAVRYHETLKELSQLEVDEAQKLNHQMSLDIRRRHDQ